MYTKSLWYIKVSLAASLALCMWVAATALASSVYNQSAINDRARNMSATIKANAQKLDPSQANSYYALVIMNIRSLSMVLAELEKDLLSAGDSSIVAALVDTTTSNLPTQTDTTSNLTLTAPTNTTSNTTTSNTNTTTPTNTTTVNPNFVPKIVFTKDSAYREKIARPLYYVGTPVYVYIDMTGGNIDDVYFSLTAGGWGAATHAHGLGTPLTPIWRKLDSSHGHPAITWTINRNANRIEGRIPYNIDLAQGKLDVRQGTNGQVVSATYNVGNHTFNPPTRTTVSGTVGSWYVGDYSLAIEYSCSAITPQNPSPVLGGALDPNDWMLQPSGCFYKISDIEKAEAAGIDISTGKQKTTTSSTSTSTTNTNTSTTQTNTNTNTTTRTSTGTTTTTPANTSTTTRTSTGTTTTTTQSTTPRLSPGFKPEVIFTNSTYTEEVTGLTENKPAYVYINMDGGDINNMYYRIRTTLQEEFIKITDTARDANGISWKLNKTANRIEGVIPYKNYPVNTALEVRHGTNGSSALGGLTFLPEYYYTKPDGSRRNGQWHVGAGLKKVQISYICTALPDNYRPVDWLRQPSGCYYLRHHVEQAQGFGIDINTGKFTTPQTIRSANTTTTTPATASQTTPAVNPNFKPTLVFTKDSAFKEKLARPLYLNRAGTVAYAYIDMNGGDIDDMYFRYYLSQGRAEGFVPQWYRFGNTHPYSEYVKININKRDNRIELTIPYNIAGSNRTFEIKQGLNGAVQTFSYSFGSYTLRAPIRDPRGSATSQWYVGDYSLSIAYSCPAGEWYPVLSRGLDPYEWVMQPSGCFYKIADVEKAEAAGIDIATGRYK